MNTGNWYHRVVLLYDWYTGKTVGTFVHHEIVKIVH